MTVTNVGEELSRKRGKTRSVFYQLPYTGRMLAGVLFSLFHSMDEGGIVLSKNLRALSLVLILVFLTVVAGCGGSPAAPAGQQAKAKITIAMVNPLTGDAATYGVSHRKGLEMAL